MVRLAPPHLNSISCARSPSLYRFKLHLRPEHLDSTAISQQDLPPLPPDLTAVDVLADFLGYLFACTRRYICETHSSGESLWESVQDQIVFVLSHPNGWEGLQQSKMRRAAVAAGLVPDTSEGRSRVRFVTEGEASLNFCVNGGLATNTIEVSAVPVPAVVVSVSDTMVTVWSRCRQTRA